MDAKQEMIADEMSERIVETVERLAMRDGAHTVNVRRVLAELRVTNRVFYNRFHNIDEVLAIIYENTTQRIREGVIAGDYDEDTFFEYVIDLVTNSLVISYEIKRKFNQYVFEYDSLSRKNYEWWTGEIRKLIDYAKQRGLIREVDSETMSYAIWCFCRGYNADAVCRGVPREEAIRSFRYSFGILLDGLKKQPVCC